MKKSYKNYLIILSIVIAITVVFYGGMKYGCLRATEKQPVLQPSQEVIQLEESFRAVSDMVSPAVVNINSEKVIKNNYNFNWPDRQNPFEGTPFEDFFKYHNIQPSEQKVSSLGSGVIVSPDGYILTNAHVIEGADKINISLEDGTTYNNVRLIGADESGDVAVLKIDAKKEFPWANLGNSDELHIGSWVIAIGNPYGFNSSITAGIVSALGRDFPVEKGNYGDFSNLIQTDASINPGNSGGPLVNMKGEVVGINTAIITPNGGSVGLGFSIPINNAKYIMDELIKNGVVIHGWLGVGLQDLSQELAKKFGIEKGVIINQVVDGGPAAKGGIEPGDVVTKIDGEDIDKVSELQRIISHRKPGEKVKITIVRNRSTMTLNITIEARPGDKTYSSVNNSQMNNLQAGDKEAETWKGLLVKEINSNIQKKYNLSDEHGVVIVAVEEGSAAASVGLKGGEIIKKINDAAISNIEDYIKAINETGGRDAVLLIKSGEYSRFIVM